MTEPRNPHRIFDLSTETLREVAGYAGAEESFRRRCREELSRRADTERDAVDEQDRLFALGWHYSTAHRSAPWQHPSDGLARFFTRPEALEASASWGLIPPAVFIPPAHGEGDESAACERGLE